MFQIMAARKFQVIVIYIYFSLHKYVYSNIVTLQKGNEICCITETTDYPIFIDPPAKMINNNKPVKFLKQDNWNNDNWLLEDVSNFSHGAVTDKRWEDFQIVKTNYQRFKSVTSVSFSVYSPFEIEFITKDDYYLDYFKLNREDQKWFSFTILLQNDKVWYLENNEVITKTTNLKPSNIFVTTKNETFWKIHKYQFMWSESAADVKPTTVAIPSTEKSCLMFYVSLCKTCVLKIPKLNHTYMSTDVAEEYVVYSWQSRRLNLELNERTLTFFKEKTDNDPKGYWGIDIRECPEIVDDNVIYRTQIIDKKPTNHFCQIMSPVGKNYKRIASVEERAECKAGKLGQPHCNVSCEAILGPKYKFCEEHRICENRKCSYIWGYTGQRNTLVIGSVGILGLVLSLIMLGLRIRGEWCITCNTLGGVHTIESNSLIEVNSPANGERDERENPYGTSALERAHILPTTSRSRSYDCDTVTSKRDARHRSSRTRSLST